MGHALVACELVEHDLRGISRRRATLDLFSAVQGGDADAAWTALREGADVMSCLGAQGRTPLHVAAECGHVAVARVLLLRGKAPVDAVDEAGRTPLHRLMEAYADACDYLDFAAEPLLQMIDVLVCWEACAAARDLAGVTPVMAAARASRPDALRSLLRPFTPAQFQPILLMRDVEGMNCLDHAYAAGSARCEQYLRGKLRPAD